MFETDGNLVLRNANNDDEVVWRALSTNQTYIDNTAFLQSNGNIVIYDKDRDALFTSVCKIYSKYAREIVRGQKIVHLD